MKLLCKTFSIFVVVVGFLPHLAFGAISITEVMYNLEGSDSGREWIELYNGGQTSVDITGWKINDGSNHILNEPPKNGGQGSLTIESGEVFIIAADAEQFLSENTTSVTVLDSVLSLGQQEGGSYTVLLINNEGDVEDSLSYKPEDGADGDGSSLHKEGGTLTAKSPSPGVYSAGGVEVAEETQSTEESVTPESGSVYAPVKTIEASIRARESIALIGAPTQFRADAYGIEGYPLENGRYMWNFGDGIRQEGQKLFHTFNYPGEYVVVLDVSSGKYSATDRMTVRAIPSEIAISALGPQNDFFIELKNPSPYDLSLSGWILQAGSDYFIIPENTFIVRGEKLTLGSSVTGLRRPANIENVVLLYPNSTIAYRYGEDLPPQTLPQNVVLAPIKKVAQEQPPVSQKMVEEKEKSLSEENFDEEEQKATLVESIPEKETKSFLMWIGALFALIFIAIFGVFALRSTRNLGDEFTIVEEAEED